MDSYATIRSRGKFLEAAIKLGIRVPKTTAITRIEDFTPWPFKGNAVLKLDRTYGGNGVSIVTSHSHAASEFLRMSTPDGLAFAIKRCMVNRDPLALWSWQDRSPREVTLQEFVQGSPANAMIACSEGKVLGIVTAEVLATQGATGAGTVIRLIQNEEIERAARLVANEFNLSGFHGLDFMIEAATGKAYLIELNPRCTQLGHLSLQTQGDLAGTLIANLTGQTMPEPEDYIKEDVVAFFPQTLNWNPKSRYLRSGFNDVPWEEPALLRQLLSEDGPDRRWISRLYHSMRGQKRRPEV
jgi:predicted ATP-grasp superfamily ATP-dependent carboligase